MKFENKKVFCSSELISELQKSIGEFGEEKVANVWFRTENGVTKCLNYDFIEPVAHVDDAIQEHGDSIVQMTLGEILTLITER